MVNPPTINDKILLIISALHKEPAHVRLIAQKTGLNHVTVLNQLNYLIESGIVTHSTKGRNKEFKLTNTKTAKQFIKIAKVYESLK